MRFGFIGAGKVGCSLGKYFACHGKELSGYYSRTKEHAKDAAEFTGSRVYDTPEDLAENSDIIFLTVPDARIAEVWEQLKRGNVEHKIICHCSGALSSKVFSDVTDTAVYGYSVHPLFAVSSRYDSYKELSKCYFTIEGAIEYLPFIRELFIEMGNPVGTIDAGAKIKYHAAAAVCSNLIVGMIAMSERLLTDCGFDAVSAHAALQPIVQGNVAHIAEVGTVDALTGPMERNDVETVEKHLMCLKDDEKAIYQMVSREVLKVARQRHPDTDYGRMEELLK
ncbi:MAG: DUF2520 domain-containing protein [Lachnospiraceae bacterium]|nr:DUF2520 domain-containing protein [Lachnospiraceae bacterium]